MLISCPKCHSVYEIPDDLIGKTGKNFRCQSCSNVWHALRSDAIGYSEEEEEELLVEPIDVVEPPIRPWPANKDEFKIPADSKSGKKTKSSKEIISDEGDPNYVPPKTQKKHEITLVSDKGPSFTISMDAGKNDEIKKEPTFSSYPEHTLTAMREDVSYTNTTHTHYDSPKKDYPTKSYITTYLTLLLIFTCAIIYFLRQEIMWVYPKAEQYYNKVGLTGFAGAENLRFEQISTAEKDNKLEITTVIYNDSPFSAKVPNIQIIGTKQTFTAERQILKGHEKTKATTSIPLPEDNKPLSLTLGFAKP